MRPASAFRRTLLVSAAAFAWTCASAANAADPVDIQKLLKANACTACHAVDRKLVGPAFHDVAAKYSGDAEAASKVATSIRNGGAGRWGQVPMPPMKALSDADLAGLAAFVLKQ